mmetsp:Transcript_25911/g.46025  ORF Transcript_25911/g.46025 Transcript_25911/m.46025 type:complete len:228 (-) Transcript_25911:265-948(-)
MIEIDTSTIWLYVLLLFFVGLLYDCFCLKRGADRDADRQHFESAKRAYLQRLMLEKRKIMQMRDKIDRERQKNGLPSLEESQADSEKEEEGATPESAIVADILAKDQKRKERKIRKEKVIQGRLKIRELLRKHDNDTIAVLKEMVLENMDSLKPVVDSYTNDEATANVRILSSELDGILQKLSEKSAALQEKESELSKEQPTNNGGGDDDAKDGDAAELPLEKKKTQ